MKGLFAVFVVVLAGCMSQPALALMDIVTGRISVTGNLEIGDAATSSTSRGELNASVWMNLDTDVGYAQLRASYGAYKVDRWPYSDEGVERIQLLSNADAHSWPIGPQSTSASASAYGSVYLKFRVDAPAVVTIDNNPGTNVPSIRRESDGEEITIPQYGEGYVLSPDDYELKWGGANSWGGFIHEGPDYCPIGDCWMGVFSGFAIEAAPVVPEPGSILIWSLLGVAWVGGRNHCRFTPV